MIQSALIDWSINPVITSLESISTPIDAMQFPTITVCKDETKEKPDNWAYLEKLLNLLEFDCNRALDENNEKCPNSTKLKNDFWFVTEGIVSRFEKWIFRNLNKTNAIDSLLDNSLKFILIENMNAIRNQSLHENLPLDYVRKLAIDNFGTRWLFPENSILTNAILNGTYKVSIKEAVSCGSSISCIKFEMMTRILLELTRVDTPFGNFLRNFLGLNEFWSFSQLKPYEELETEVMFGFDKTSLCEFLTLEESFVHEYFVNLSTLADFNKTEWNDLYELPGILGTADDINHIKMSQFQLFSWCRENSDVEYEETRNCGINSSNKSQVVFPNQSIVFQER